MAQRLRRIEDENAELRKENAQRKASAGTHSPASTGAGSPATRRRAPAKSRRKIVTSAAPHLRRPSLPLSAHRSPHSASRCAETWMTTRAGSRASNTPSGSCPRRASARPRAPPGPEPPCAQSPRASSRTSPRAASRAPPRAAARVPPEPPRAHPHACAHLAQSTYRLTLPTLVALAHVRSQGRAHPQAAVFGQEGEADEEEEEGAEGSGQAALAPVGAPPTDVFCSCAKQRWRRRWLAPGCGAPRVRYEAHCSDSAATTRTQLGG